MTYTVITVTHRKSNGRHVYTAQSEYKSLAPQSRETAEAAVGALIQMYPDKFGVEIKSKEE